MRYRTGVVSTRESDTPCLSALDAQIMEYSCTDTFQYIHIVSTHIQDNVLICLVYVSVFSQCAQMYQLYELISFGSLVSFWSLPSVLFFKKISKFILK